MTYRWGIFLAGLLLSGVVSPALARPAPVTPPPELDRIPTWMLVDIGSGQVLAARNPAQPFLPASITKVMTAYVAFRELSAGQLRPLQEFTVSENVARQWGHRVTGLGLRTPGVKLTADTLLHAIVTVSANDAAVVLAEGYAGSVPAWSDLMNREARRLGMKDSRFASPSGWPDGGQTVVSPRDLVTLATAMIREYPLYYRLYFMQRSMTYNGHTQRNHNPILDTVVGADGIKTGHTFEAGYTFLGSAERDGRRLVMVLGGADSPRLRAEAAKALMDWGFDAWRTRSLFEEGAVVARAPVQQGASSFIPLVSGSKIYATMPSGTTQPVRLSVHYDGPLVAPVAKGTKVADLEIDVLGQKPVRVPLYAGQNVGKANTAQRIFNGLANMLRGQPA